MYGETITLTCEGKSIDIFVFCVPGTPKDELKRRAIQILMQKNGIAL